MPQKQGARQSPGSRNSSLWISLAACGFKVAGSVVVAVRVGRRIEVEVGTPVAEGNGLSVLVGVAVGNEVAVRKEGVLARISGGEFSVTQPESVTSRIRRR